MTTRNQLIAEVSSAQKSREALIAEVDVDRVNAFRAELDNIFITGGDIESLMDHRMKETLKLHPDSDGLKAKLANSFYLADAYGMDPRDAFDGHDALVERIFGRGTDSKGALARIINAKKKGMESVRRRLTEKTLYQASKDAFSQAGLRMTKSLAGYAELTGYLGASVSPVFDDAFERQAEWGRMMSEGVNVYYQEHPEEFIQAKGSGFIETTKAYLDSPVAIYQGILEAVPLMMEAYLGHIVAGAAVTAVGAAPKTIRAAQWIGRVQGMAVPIMGENYANLRDRGQHPMSALPQAFLTAQIEALIEEWVIHQRLKIFSGQGVLARKGISTTVVKALYGAGKSYVRGSAEEFTQAINSNFWDMVFTDSGTKLLDGAMEQAAAGGLIELGMGGGFAIAGQARSLVGKKQVPNEAKLQRLEAVRDMFNKSELSQEHKDEVNEECDRVRDEIAAEVDKKALEEPVAAEKPVEPPVEPEVVPEAAPKPVEAQPAVQPEPKNIQEAIDRTPRYGLGPDGKTVIDYETQKEVGSYDTGARAVREMTNLNSGVTTIAEERPAKLLPSEKDKTYTIRQLLNFTMKGMEKGARQGFLDGARSIITQRRDLARYAHARLKALDITKTQRKQLIDAVARTRTSAEKTAAIATINVLFEQATHALATKNLRKTVRYVNQHLGRIMQEQGIRPEYLELIRDLTETFAFTKPTEQTVKRLESLKKHIDSLREAEMDRYERDFAEELLPKGLVEKLDKLAVKSVKDMTADEVRDIDVALRMLIHLNNIKNRMILDRVARNASVIINGAMDELDNVIDKSVVPDERILKTDFQSDSGMGKFIRWVATTDNHDLETLVDTITGSQKGFAFEAVIEAFSDGRTKRDEFSNKVADAVMDTFDDNNISLRDLQKQSPAFERLFKTEKTKALRNFFSTIFGIVSTPKLKVSLAGKTLSLTKAELMSIYMHSNARYNLKAMLKEGVASSRSRIGVMTPEEVSKIATIIEADPKALACCNMASELYAGLYKDAINSESLDMKGIELANEDNYWHIERYTGGGIAGAETFRLSLLESTGWIQPRTGSKNPIIIKDFWEVFINSKKAISEYVGMAKAYRATKMLFNYKNYREKIRSLGYGEELAAIDENIRNTEQQPLSRAPIDSVVARLMRGTVRVGLSFPGTWIGQWASVFNYFTETSKKYISPANVAPANEKEIQRYRNNWAFFRARMDGGVSSIALQDISQSDEVLRNFVQKVDWVNYVTQAIHSVDIRTVAAGGRITEAEMADKNRTGRSQEYWERRGIEPSTIELNSPDYWYEFNKRARFLVRRTQPMFEGENRSLHTGVREPAKRMWFLFRSYVDQVLRMAQRENTARINNVSSKSDMATNLATIWMSLAMFSVIQWLTAKALYRDERDWKDLGMDIALGPLKLLTIIGHPLKLMFKKLVADRLNKKVAMYEPRADTIVTQFVNEVLKASDDIAEGIGQIGTKNRYKGGPNDGKLKAEVLIEKGALSAIALVAEYFGIPASRVKRIYEGWTKKPKRLGTAD